MHIPNYRRYFKNKGCILTNKIYLKSINVNENENNFETNNVGLYLRAISAR